MSNTPVNPAIIAQEALFQLKNELVLANLVYRGYEQEFSQQVNGFKVGDTVTIRKPVKYTVRSGAAMQVQDTVMGTTSIKVDQLQGVDLQFSVQEMTLNISRLSELHIKPAMTKLAQKIDQDIAALYKDIPSWVGTPGQTINSFADYLKGTVRLNDFAVPMDMRRGIITPADRAGLLSAFPAMYMQNAIAGDALTRGKLPPIDDTELYMSQLIKRHTTGSYSRSGSVAEVNGTITATTWAATYQDANYYQDIATDGWSLNAQGVLKAGDVITFEGVNAVNPESLEDLGYLRQFVVVSDVNANGSGQATVRVTPPIITSGPYQTCTQVPADNADLTLVGSGSTAYPQNMIFHRNAFALAMVPLEPLQGIQGVTQLTQDGITVTLTPVADGVNYVQRWRLDVLYGVKTIYRELATRISGS